MAQERAPARGVDKKFLARSGRNGSHAARIVVCGGFQALRSLQRGDMWKSSVPWRFYIDDHTRTLLPVLREPKYQIGEADPE
eukprot:CAMPEP_0204308392 /NCGR_PEP_ID=MMETSP0469-20131031/483_1 /ASSEMBLY_ACC=CAM_ASM_000384 /TAXON_ID=2969 /ORGANISM="Oxyrrhis marina" /LENGTH=81 /DNA_ID=CAMNT_0051287867 /DNA_START=44 /DNA_END=289 /DNA_ORIENTATION=+